MKRTIVRLLTPVVLVAGFIVSGALPAAANASITATSVAPNADGTKCSDASFDLGMESTSVTTETGQVTNSAGEVLDSFDQSSDFSGFSGVFEGYGMPFDDDQPTGTIIASYATIGAATPTAADTAEWYLLYRCGDTMAESVVLMSCFGDYGTCPKTAEEGLATLFAGTVSDTTPRAGDVITAHGEGCFYPLGGAVLLNGATGVDGGTVAPNADGTFDISLTVPAGLAPGSELTVRIDCGYDGQTVLSNTVTLRVDSEPATTTTAPSTTTTSTTALRSDIVVTPRFAG